MTWKTTRVMNEMTRVTRTRVTRTRATIVTIVRPLTMTMTHVTMTIGSGNASVDHHGHNTYQLCFAIASRRPP